LEIRSGLAHNAISRIENGDVSPRLETLERIAAALTISIERLQFGKADPEATAGGDGNDLEILVAELTALPADKRGTVATILTELIRALKESP